MLPIVIFNNALFLIISSLGIQIYEIFNLSSILWISQWEHPFMLLCFVRNIFELLNNFIGCIIVSKS